ncbi:MAG: ABC transporter substrate-binding protein [Burkholderiaceae bacterium]
MKICRKFAALLVVASAAVALPALGKTLRHASAFDPQSMDPHSLALLYHTRIVTQVYEGLVNRDKDFKLEPALAVSWQALDAATWRFKLRPNVRFHDGAPMTADDVIFSIERARAPTSQRRFTLGSVKSVRKVDDLTIDVVLDSPDAVLPEKLYLVFIMSKAWAVKNVVEKPQDFNGKQETFAVRNANGTGPFMLDRYEADKQTVLKANSKWWGKSGNVTEAIYLVIQSDATRLAALASAQVDFVVDPPFQDVARLKQEPRIRTTTTTDIGTQFLTFDQARDQLQFGEARGNPFKDVRVRRAIYQAIDIDLIIQKVLRGQAKATGSFISQQVDGYVPALDKRLPFDPPAARSLLKEAGYGDGFAVTLDCVNIKFREAVCQAISAMLTQVGIRTQLQSMPSAMFFPKLSQAATSFVEYGWTPTPDPWPSFNALYRTYDAAGSGAFNAGRYSNRQVDQLIDAIRIEPDLAKRRQLIGDTLRLLNTDLPYLPLFRRTLTWAMRDGVRVTPWPNDVLELRWVQID